MSVVPEIPTQFSILSIKMASIMSKAADKSSKRKNRIFTFICTHKNATGNFKQCHFGAMLLTEARLKFIKDIVSFNLLEKLASNSFFKIFLNKGKFGYGPVIC